MYLGRKREKERERGGEGERKREKRKKKLNVKEHLFFLLEGKWNRRHLDGWAARQRSHAGASANSANFTKRESQPGGPRDRESGKPVHTHTHLEADDGGPEKRQVKARATIACPRMMQVRAEKNRECGLPCQMG